MKKIFATLILLGTLSLSSFGADVYVRYRVPASYDKGTKIEFVYGKIDDVKQRIQFILNNYYVYEITEVKGALMILYKEN